MSEQIIKYTLSILFSLWILKHLLMSFCSWLWLTESIPLGGFGPWVLAVSIWRWPNKVKLSKDQFIE